MVALHICMNLIGRLELISMCFSLFDDDVAIGLFNNARRSFRVIAGYELSSLTKIVHFPIVFPFVGKGPFANMQRMMVR